MTSGFSGNAMHSVCLQARCADAQQILRGTPYIIRSAGRNRGLFSLLSGVVCHLHISEIYGLEPLVDFRGHITEYNEDSTALPTDNAWEYYFKQPSDRSLGDAIHQPLAIFSSTEYPSGYTYSISSDSNLFDVFQRRIKVQDHLVDEADSWAQSHLDSKCLGVHWRAQEMRTTPGHWLPPNKLQIEAAIDSCLNAMNIDNIFVVTEDATCLELLKRRYGRRLIFRDNFRTRSPVNAYRIYPRPLHKYNLGKECLIDCLILAKCIGLIRCTSNIAEGARLFKQGTFGVEIKINNGPNIRGGLAQRLRLHKFLWNIKNILPASLGGFSTKAIQTL